ncbi:MAG: hypothetical protein ACLQBD_27555 [Syntrophobacteraceae bacterium]
MKLRRHKGVIFGQPRTNVYLHAQALAINADFPKEPVWQARTWTVYT